MAGRGSGDEQGPATCVGRRTWFSNQRGRPRFPVPRLHGKPDAPCVHEWGRVRLHVENGVAAPTSASPADLGTEQTGVNYLIIKPGQREAFAHRHREAEEIYVVLVGSGRVKLDDDLVDLTRLDAVRVSPGTARSLEAGPDGLEILIFGPHVEGDVEMVPDFWAA